MKSEVWESPKRTVRDSVNFPSRGKFKKDRVASGGEENIRKRKRKITRKEEQIRKKVGVHGKRWVRGEGGKEGDVKNLMY